MGQNKHEAEGRMVRPTPESHFVTKQRNAEAVNRARRIIQGLEKEGDLDRLVHLINRGAVIRIGKKQMSLAMIQREAATRKAKRGHDDGKQGK